MLPAKPEVLPAKPNANGKPKPPRRVVTKKLMQDGACECGLILADTYSLFFGGVRKALPLLTAVSTHGLGLPAFCAARMKSLFGRAVSVGIGLHPEVLNSPNRPTDLVMAKVCGRAVCWLSVLASLSLLGVSVGGCVYVCVCVCVFPSFSLCV